MANLRLNRTAGAGCAGRGLDSWGQVLPNDTKSALAPAAKPAVPALCQRSASGTATTDACPQYFQQAPQRGDGSAPSGCPPHRYGPNAANSPHPNVPPCTKPSPKTALEPYIPQGGALHESQRAGAQLAHAATSATVQLHKVYPALDISKRWFEYRAAPDKRSWLGSTNPTDACIGRQKPKSGSM